MQIDHISEIIIAEISQLRVSEITFDLAHIMRPNLDTNPPASPPGRMLKEPYVTPEGVKETRSRGGSPSSSASHQKFTAPCNGRACTITGAFCYPYLAACTRNQTEGEDDAGWGGGRGGGKVVAGGRNGEKKRRQDRSKMGSHSLGPFLLYGGKALYVLPRRTVGGEVYTTPLAKSFRFRCLHFRYDRRARLGTRT